MADQKDRYSLNGAPSTFMTLLLPFLLGLLSAVSSKINLTGVDPSKQHLYEGKSLRCPGENGKPLTPDMINDDFCDCPEDGFDEPGRRD